LPRLPTRSAAVSFILVSLGLDALGIGIVIPILPELVRRLAGLPPAAAALPVGLLVTCFAAAQLLASPVLGGLSDCYGRRPVLLLSITGLAANYLLLAWAPSLPWLYLGRLLAGATSANVSSASAYIADITPEAERGRRFGLIGAAFSVGFLLGPALGGWLGGIGLRLPFFVSAALAGTNLLYGLFVLPESLPRERRRPFAWRGANPVGALRLLAADAALRRLGLAWACMWFGLGTLQTVFVLYTIARFGWGPPQNGAAMATIGFTGAFVQIFLVRRAIVRLGERRTGMVGCAASAVAHTAVALAPAGWTIYPVICFYALGQLATPAVRALVSSRAGPERQGQTMGALSSVEGLTAIASPLIASSLFSAFAGVGAWLSVPGAPFLAAAVAFLVALRAVQGLAPAS
jgi:MFS transporter, DHA1 family, tetracycline resistance protein